MAWTMTTLALALAAGGAGVQAVGSWRAGTEAREAGEAERRAADSQAELAEYNASVADLQAQDAVDRGAEEEGRFRQGVRAMIGSQRTGIAAAGVDVGFGSAVDVQADAAFLGELDALTIRTNAAREAWGYKVEAEDLRRRADIARKTGVFAERAGRANQTAARIGAVGSLVGSGASLLVAQYGFARRGR